MQKFIDFFPSVLKSNVLAGKKRTRRKSKDQK